MNVCPAIVIEPERTVVPVLAATLYLAVPEPLPLAPDVIVIQGTPLTAVHAHPGVVPTAIEPVLAPAATVAFAGVIV